MLFVEDTRLGGKEVPQYFPSMLECTCALESPSKMVNESQLKLFVKMHVSYYFFFPSYIETKEKAYLPAA